MATQEPNVSVNWNGVVYTAHANKGARFGTGTGPTAEDAVKAALSDLEHDPDRHAPTTPEAHTTAVGNTSVAASSKTPK